MRKALIAERSAKAEGRAITGLWWVSAHTNPTGALPGNPNASAEAAKKWGVSKGGPGDAAAAKGPQLTQGGFENKIKRSLKLAKKKRKKVVKVKPTGLPRSFIYVTYTLAFLFIAACSYFIMLFGLTFEPAISRAWLLSSFFALFLEFFVTNPLALVGSAVATTEVEGVLERRKDKTGFD